MAVKADVKEVRCSNLYSRNEISRCLHAGVHEFSDALAVPIQWGYWDARNILGISSCVIGTYASLWLDYPEDKGKLWACVLGFFVLYGLINYMDYFMLNGLAAVFSDDKNENRRYFLHVELEPQAQKVTMNWSCPHSSVSVLSKKRDLARYFFTDGEMALKEYLQDLKNDLDSFRGMVKAVK